jgi:peroxiredoxin
MKFVLFLAFCLPFYIYSQQNGLRSPEIIELDVRHVDGYGPFKKSYTRVSMNKKNPNSIWGKTQDVVKGIPDGWEDAVVGHIVFDYRQFAYQKYMTGKLDSSFFEELIVSWNINFEERPLSPEPINCYINILAHQSHHSEFKYILDKNNNLDFSDDEVVNAPYFYDINNLDSLYKIFSHEIDYETLIGGEVVQKKLKILLLNDNRGNLSVTYPSHGETYFKNHVIKISNRSGSMMIAKEVSLMLCDLLGNTIDTLPVEYMGFIEIDGDYYQNLGYFHDKQVIRLQKIPADKDREIYASQVNFKAKPFTGKEFTTGATIKLEDYKGKYLFIEFWGSWCGPCLEAMPKIKDAYDSLDKEKIAFLGIAKDKPDALSIAIKHFDIQWEQILSDEENRIIEAYHVQGYPTTLLINPEGVVITKNIRSSVLLETLRELMGD